jgi:hypothetical protein
MTKKILNGDELFEICSRLQEPIASFSIGEKEFDIYDTSVLSDASHKLLARSNAMLQRFFEPIIKVQQRQEAGEIVTEETYQQAALVGLRQDKDMLNANLDYISAHIETEPRVIIDLIEAKLAEFKERLQKTISDPHEINKRIGLQRISFCAKLSLTIRQEIQKAQATVTEAIASIEPEKNIALLSAVSEPSDDIQNSLNGASRKKEKVATPS